AGNLTVNAGAVLISDHGLIVSSTFGSGRGGNVIIAATGAIATTTAGGVAASAPSIGNAGSISLSAREFSLFDGATISTEASVANGGDISINVGGIMSLRRSSITTSVEGALGNGGNIAIDPRFLILNQAVIQANAVGGNGGNISIVADQIVQSADS